MPTYVRKRFGINRFRLHAEWEQRAVQELHFVGVDTWLTADIVIPGPLILFVLDGDAFVELSALQCGAQLSNGQAMNLTYSRFRDLENGRNLFHREFLFIVKRDHHLLAFTQSAYGAGELIFYFITKA